MQSASVKDSILRIDFLLSWNVGLSSVFSRHFLTITKNGVFFLC
jgi:hypothetical protein